jgi:hypothetical protein
MRMAIYLMTEKTRDFSSIFGERIWKLVIVKYFSFCSETGHGSDDFLWGT